MKKFNKDVKVQRRKKEKKRKQEEKSERKAQKMMEKGIHFIEMFLYFSASRFHVDVFDKMSNIFVFQSTNEV